MQMEPNFSNGTYRTSTGQLVLVHTWMESKKRWYGYWPQNELVLYFTAKGVCSNQQEVGQLVKRRRGEETI